MSPGDEFRLRRDQPGPRATATRPPADWAVSRPAGHPAVCATKRVTETDHDQSQLTPRYTADATGFIDKSAAARKPLFLYFAHTFPHVPLAASNSFLGRSPRGLYGDAVEKLDWPVGEVIRTLVRLKLDENTLVLFSSDNGGAVNLGIHGGSTGTLREGKGTSWEGGMREPSRGGTIGTCSGSGIVGALPWTARDAFAPPAKAKAPTGISPIDLDRQALMALCPGPGQRGKHGWQLNLSKLRPELFYSTEGDGQSRSIAAFNPSSISRRESDGRLPILLVSFARSSVVT